MIRILLVSILFAAMVCFCTVDDEFTVRDRDDAQVIFGISIPMSTEEKEAARPVVMDVILERREITRSSCKEYKALANLASTQKVESVEVAFSDMSRLEQREKELDISWSAYSESYDRYLRSVSLAHHMGFKEEARYFGYCTEDDGFKVTEYVAF